MKSHHAPWIPMVDVLPPGEVGKAKIEHFEVAEVPARAYWHPDEWINPGKYVRLMIGGGLWMSDGHAEQSTNYDAVQATGDILIGGLGIGMVLLPLLRSPVVISVTVVELHQDVIDLVEPHIRAAAGWQEPKLRVVQGDVFDWRPEKGTKYDFIYMDIWKDLSTDQIKEMQELHKRFKRHLKPGGKVTSWRYKSMLSRRKRGW